MNNNLTMSQQPLILPAQHTAHCASHVSLRQSPDLRAPSAAPSLVPLLPLTPLVAPLSSLRIAGPLPRPIRPISLPALAGQGPNPDDRKNKANSVVSYIRRLNGYTSAALQSPS